MGVLLVAPGSSGPPAPRASRVRCSRPHPLRKLHAIHSKPGQPRPLPCRGGSSPCDGPCAPAPRTRRSALEAQATTADLHRPERPANSDTPPCVLRSISISVAIRSSITISTAGYTRRRRRSFGGDDRPGPPQTPHLAPRQTAWHHTKQDTTKNHCQTAQTARTAITATAPSPRWSSPKLA